LVRLLIAQQRARPGTGAVDHAHRLLDRLLAAARTSGRAGSLVEIRMLQALALDAQGHRTQARAALGRALSEASEPGQYVRLFLDEGASMVELLLDLTRHGVAADHADRLLSFDTSASGAGQRPPSSPDSLSKRELQVLRLLGSELSGPQIAGELFISHNTLRTHTKHIFTKLEVASRQAAVRRARERGLM
jgi:LuxR family maltose regulon positive regulatory protein